MEVWQTAFIQTKEVYKNLEVVGLYKSKDYSYDYIIYVTDNVLYELSDAIRITSAINFEINDQRSYFVPKMSPYLSTGTIYVYDSISYCEMNECKNKTLNIKVQDEYYEDSGDFKVANIITKKNIKSLVHEEYQDDIGGVIYFAEEDYNIYAEVCRCIIAEIGGFIKEDK